MLRGMGLALPQSIPIINLKGEGVLMILPNASQIDWDWSFSQCNSIHAWHSSYAKQHRKGEHCMVFKMGFQKGPLEQAALTQS